jgi:hypothetical protein
MKRCLSSLLVSLIFGLWVFPADAQAPLQFSVGPWVGYTSSTTHFTDHEYFKTSYRPGLEVGITASLRVGHFALQPAVCYAQQGYRLAFTIPGDAVFEALRYSGNTRLDYLVFPLSLAYSLRSDGQGWQIFAGPYLGLLLRGRYTSLTAFGFRNTGNFGPDYESAGTVDSERNYDPTNYNTAYTKGTDAGLQGGLGYQYRGFLLQASYSLGLRNIQYKRFAANVNYDDSIFPYYNRSFQFSLAYLFGTKSKR